MKLLSPLFIALLFCLAGCETPFYVAVPTGYKPTSFFSKDTTTIVMINQFNADGQDISNKKKLAAIKSGAYIAINAAGKLLAQLPHVKTINLVDSANFKADTGSIKLIAQKYKAGYVLTLKSYDSGITLGDIVGGKAVYNAYATVNFLLYENNGVYYKKLNGTALDAKTEEQYLHILSTGLYDQGTGQTVAPANSSAEHAVKEALKEYLGFIVTHNRPMYDDDFLLPAIRQIQTSNYARADSLLHPFLLDKDPARAGKAAYALAVVHEAKGSIGTAIDYARLALKNDETNYFASLILDDLQYE